MSQLSKNGVIKEYLSKIHAPYLEDWSMIGCDIDDDDLQVLAQTILSKYNSKTTTARRDNDDNKTSPLVKIDLSNNQIRNISFPTIQYFPKTLRILILNGNPIFCEKSEDVLTGNGENSHDRNKNRSSNNHPIKDLLFSFPHLGYVGDNINKCCLPLNLINELHHIMKENRNRCRIQHFHERVVAPNQHGKFPLGLWPIMFYNALEAFRVSTWDGERNSGSDTITQYQKQFSIFQNDSTNDVKHHDAIFLMLRHRGVNEIFSLK